MKGATRDHADECFGWVRLPVAEHAERLSFYAALDKNLGELRNLEWVYLQTIEIEPLEQHCVL